MAKPEIRSLSLAVPVGSAEAVGRAAAAAFASGVTRVTCLVPTADWPSRRALQRAGFRREGVLRQAVLVDESPSDAHLYALLASDVVAGEAVFSTVMNTVLPRTRTIGHVLFTDPNERVLLLEVSYKRDWELPGGVVEPHESPRVGAEREVSEEIGLTVELERVRVIDWLPPYLGWDDAVELIFDGGVLDPATPFVLGEGEIVAAHWVSRDEIVSRVTPLAARRLEWLLDHHEAPTALFENGYAIDAAIDGADRPD